MALESGASLDVGLLADAALGARHAGDRALARRFVDAVLAEAQPLDASQSAGASAALSGAVLRVEGGQARPGDAFPEALRWAGTDDEILAVIGEWTWATLEAEGPQAAMRVAAEGVSRASERVARLRGEALAASVTGFSGRWGQARNLALALAGRLRLDDPAKLHLTVHTLLAMAAAFDGPSDLALRSGVIAQRLFAEEPAIPMTQAIYGVVGEIYGLGQARGFEAAIARARRASRQSITGVAFVEHLGIWSGSIANLATAAAVLTEYTRFEAEEAMRLLRWRDLCGLLSLAVQARGLFAALSGELGLADRYLDEYDADFRPREFKTTTIGDRGRAWLAFQRGDVDGALEWADRAWAAAWEHGDIATWAAPAAHDLVRFGRPERAIERLRAAADRLAGPFSSAMVDHAVALAEGDPAKLEAAAVAFGRVGAVGLQAEALLQAAALAPSGQAAEQRRRGIELLADSFLRTPIVAAAQGSALACAPAANGTAGVVDLTASPLEPGVGLRRAGKWWLLEVAGSTISLRDLTGLRYLAVLLANPGVEVRSATLANAASPPARSPQAVLDDEARRSIEDRARTVLTELARARAKDRRELVEKLEDEAEALAAELRRSHGLRGESRTFADHDELARTSVRKAIKRAIDEIAQLHEPAGDYLRSRVTTGTSCLFELQPSTESVVPSGGTAMARLSL